MNHPTLPKPSNNRSPARQQRGAALLMAMITVTLVAALASTALWHQWRGVEVEAAERSRLQAGWLLTGALDWGRLILQGDLAEDQRKRQLVDHLGEPWAVPLAEARLATFLAAGESTSTLADNVFLSGQITDMQSRLNIMNLAARQPEAQLAALIHFGRLFDLLGLPHRSLGSLQRMLTRAQEAFDEPDGEGEADDAPLLPTRFEQLRWLGVPADTLKALKPYATLLPLHNGRATTININTAPPEVLYAAIDELRRNDSERLVQWRDRQYFDSVARMTDALGRPLRSTGGLAVASDYFEIRGRLRLHDSATEEVALVQRSTGVRGRRVQVLWRLRQALDIDPDTGTSRHH